MSLHYDGQEFTSHGLYATAIMPEQWGAEWRWGMSDERPWIKGQNLRGTCRTLDDVDGRVELDNGILDGRGITAVEDTTAPIQDSWPTAREKGSHDVYIFAYGWDFRAAVADYYRLTGAQPILPRYALGNWWSRYHRYSADEYLQLMQGFSEHQIPLSVAVIDMDWHLVDGHRLVPYLHSEQCWGHQNLAPLIEPMYWETPESDGAWNVPYQYRFGRQLVVAPLTDPEDDASGLARVDVFLPQGKWVDLLTGHVYRGGRTMAMYRPLEYLPVLASEGAIVPLAGHCAHDEASLLSLGAEPALGAERALSPMTDTEHPVDIEVVIVAGSDGGYELVEDDGCDGGVSSRTLLIWNDRERCLTVKAAVVAGLNERNEALVPPKRRWKVRLFDGDGGVHTTLTGELATCEEHRIFIHHTEQKDDPQAGAWLANISMLSVSLHTPMLKVPKVTITPRENNRVCPVSFHVP